MKLRSHILSREVYYYFLVASLFCIGLRGQPIHELGNPFIKNYSAKTYKGFPQVFDVVQDDKGILFFTGYGVTEFDGKNWRKIPPLNMLTFSLALGNDNKIYVGGTDDLGFLDIDSLGQYEFRSLKYLIPEEYQNFGQLRQVTVLEDQIFFSSRTGYLIGFNSKENTIKVWNKDLNLKILGVWKGQLYLEKLGVGLCQLSGTEISPVAQAEKSKDFSLNKILAYKKNQLLLVTKSSGLYIYDQSELKPFPTEIDSYLKGWTFDAELLPDQTYLLSVLGQGLLQINESGHWLRHLNKKKGLIDDIVISSLFSEKGGLWVTTNAGISQVDFMTGVSKFNLDKQDKLLSIEDLLRFKGQLYVASSGRNGILSLDKKQQVFKSLNKLPSGQAFGLFSFKNKLIGATDSGVFEIIDNQVKPLLKHKSIQSLITVGIQSQVDKDYLLVGHQHGFGVLKNKNQEWAVKMNFNEIPDNVAIRSLLEYTPGRLLLGTENQGIWDIDYAISEDAKFQIIDKKNFRQGLDGMDLGNTFVYRLNGKLYLTGAGGIYKLPKHGQQLLPDHSFELPAAPENIQKVLLAEDNQNTIIAYFLLYSGEAKIGQYRVQEDQSYSFDQSLFGNIPNEDLLSINKIYPENENLLWLAGQEGLLRIATKYRQKKKPYTPQIRKLVIDANSILYKGHGAVDPPVLKFGFNNLSFQYIQTGTRVGEDISYQTRLKGFENEWSPWTLKTEKSYTKLMEGSYLFEVRAKNGVEIFPGVATFSFKILPPWWRTWLAYLIYLVLILSFLLGLSRWRNNKLLQRSSYLQSLVKERTTEIEKHIQELSAINNIQKLLVSHLNITDLFYQIGESIRTLFKVEYVLIAIFNTENTKFDFPYFYGEGLLPNDLDCLLLKYIIDNRKPLLFDKEGIDNNQELASKILSQEKGKYLGVPIYSNQEILGVINIQSNNSKLQFNLEDQALILTIAAQLGVALSNKRLFEEAKLARAHAEESNAAKSTFLSTVSHELRTPLTSIIGFTKIIKRRLEDRILHLIKPEDKKVERAIKQVRENLDVVISEGERLTKLINTLLDLAKIEAGRLDWHMESLSIEKVIRQAEAATASLIEEKQLNFFVEIEKGLPKVLGDKDRLIQVLINLISNAVKFTNEGFILIKTFKNDRQIIVQVEDTGQGIKKEDLPKVFEKFKQVGNTLTDKPKGTGLGLPICKEIISHHQGDVWAESSLGEGSVFFFSLPCIEIIDKQEIGSEEVGTTAKQQVLIRKNTENSNLAPAHLNTILIVDDEPKIRNLLIQEISEGGYYCKQAGNGKQALKIIAREQPELIILDLEMPEMDGFEVASILRGTESTRNIPILVVSVMEDRARFEALNIDGYFSKPIDIDQLLYSIDCLLPKATKNQLVNQKNN